MDHVAILKKSWGLIPKILNGQKTIESRWSKYKSVPWGKVFPGDTVYFKDSGSPVSIKAGVSRVVSFSKLTLEKKKELVNKYGGEGKISFSDKKSALNWAKKKNYCTLIFLKNPKKVKPFNINKSGFGISSAWMVVNNIGNVKRV